MNTGTVPLFAVVYGVDSDISYVRIKDYYDNIKKLIVIIDDIIK